MNSPATGPKFPLKKYLNGLATMTFVFGLVTFVSGQQDPWGTRQFVGLGLALSGIALLAVARFVLK